MLIDLREFLSGAGDEQICNTGFSMNRIDNGVTAYDVVKSVPFELRLAKIDKKKVSVKGEGTVILNIPCDRCLETVETRIDFKVDEMLDFSEKAGEEEPEEKDYMDGYDLDVDKLVFDEILLSMPGKTLCREDCKGLCPVCGANLNVAECGCDRTSLDPRMSVFQDILNNFKEV